MQYDFSSTITGILFPNQSLNQSVTDRQTYEICLLFNFQSRRSSTSDRASFQPPIQVLLARSFSAFGGVMLHLHRHLGGVLHLHLHHHQVSRRPHFSWWDDQKIVTFSSGLLNWNDIVEMFPSICQLFSSQEAMSPDKVEETSLIINQRCKRQF